MLDYKSLYPYFGGKGKPEVVAEVWRRFGRVDTYIEPFYGSGVIHLNNPFWKTTTETINDLDHYVSNFWRALQRDPEKVAYYADYPVVETDLHARHVWLVNEGRERIAACEWDKDHFDAEVAGMWVWGMALWIGGGFCSGRGAWTSAHLQAAHETGTYDVREIEQQLPHLGNNGQGVTRQLPQLRSNGQGVTRQLPRAAEAENNLYPFPKNESLYAYLARLAERMKDVRVCCGDWKRVVQPAVTWAGEDGTQQATCGVFLDPPYSDGSDRDVIYNRDSFAVAHEVRAWCIENEANPNLRIALCGYAGEGHDELAARGWAEFRWKAAGGYSAFSAREQSKINRGRETIWFSPACQLETLPLFGGLW